MVQALNAFVTQLETLGRAEHFDSEGGGRITRVLYCEPYTAHKRVVTALKGTVYAADAGRWERALPHADPLYPWFYCTDVQVEPFFPSAVRGSIGKGFNAAARFGGAITGNGLEQFTPIQTALNRIDDFDGASDIDNLSVTEIAQGGIIGLAGQQTQLLNTDEQIEQGPFTSRGRCGAKITATYSPLLFMPGLSTEINAGPKKFDYVDPQWEPLTITTATGRSLSLYSPQGGILGGIAVVHGGLTDAYALPEVVWRFSIRRLMVPWIPAYTVAMFANHVNKNAMAIGSLQFPAGTVRMETPEIITRRAPDGQMMHDILLKFLVRRLYDEHYIPPVAGAPDFGIGGSFQKGWIGWNWQYGIPSGGLLDAVNWINPRGGYYPVCWNGGLFQLFGTNHPLFLHDTPPHTDLAQIPVSTDLTASLNGAPFQAGMREGQ